MNKINFNFTLLWMMLIFITSCSENVINEDSLNGNSNLTSNPPFGLSDKMKIGFSFEKGGVISYPNTNDIIPDFTIRPNNYYTAENVSIYFEIPSSIELSKFYLLEEFDNENSALEYFNNISELQNEIAMDSDSDNSELLPNQIWLIKTKYSNYGVIRIIDTDYEVIDYSPQSVTIVKINFDWKFQPNGTQNF